MSKNAHEICYGNDKLVSHEVNKKRQSSVVDKQIRKILHANPQSSKQINKLKKGESRNLHLKVIL